MDFSKLVNERESVRSYDPNRPVPKNILIKILDAARIAPSAANKQPWKFIVLSSPEVLEKVRKSYVRPWFCNAPHVLAVVGNKSSAWVRSYDKYCSIETDLAIALTHIILAATNEGVATCWISNFDPHILRKALKMSDDEVVFGITPLGYPQADYKHKEKKERKNLEEVVEWR